MAVLILSCQLPLTPIATWATRSSCRCGEERVAAAVGVAAWQVAIFSPWPELCRANRRGDHRSRRRPIAHVRAVVQVEQQGQIVLPAIC